MSDALSPMRLGVTQEDLEALSHNAILGTLDPRELAALIEVLAQLAVTPGRYWRTSAKLA